MTKTTTEKKGLHFFIFFLTETMSMRPKPLRPRRSAYVVVKKPVDFAVSLGRSVGERRVPCTIFDVSCTAAIKKKLAGLGVARRGGEVKWRRIIPISGLLLAAAIEQQLAGLGVVSRGGKMKRRPPIFIP
eukprot:Rhum_TRINITY_DN15256_c1_g2::Rhum_TRINITY_DN15256_c1_g2_i1::g.147654::m.147654